MRDSPKRSPLALLGFVGLTAAAAFLGSRTMAGHSGSSGKSLWYRSLRKPPFQPPPQVFGPVWGVLYSLIAYSGYRVYRQPSSPERTQALALWGAQLGLNAMWTPLFFGKLGGKHHPRAALADVAILTPLIALYLERARKVDRVAAAAVGPYLAWSSFATLLNEEIVRRNA